MNTDWFFWTACADRRRMIVAVVAAISALAHIPVIGPHLSEAPYMGEEFIVLTVACLTIAVALAYLDAPAVYAATIVTCGLAVVGYILTRLVAFPELGDDVGNWFEPLGVISVIAETTAVALAAWVLRDRVRDYRQQVRSGERG